MRERGIKHNINRANHNDSNQLILDKFRELDSEHLQKRQGYLHSIDRKMYKYENRLEQEKLKLQNSIKYNGNGVHHTVRDMHKRRQTLNTQNSEQTQELQFKRKQKKLKEALAQIIGRLLKSV